MIPNAGLDSATWFEAACHGLTPLLPAPGGSIIRVGEFGTVGLIGTTANVGERVGEADWGPVHRTTGPGTGALVGWALGSGVPVRDNGGVPLGAVGVPTPGVPFGTVGVPRPGVPLIAVRVPEGGVPEGGVPALGVPETGVPVPGVLVALGLNVGVNSGKVVGMRGSTDACVGVGGKIGVGPE